MSRVKFKDFEEGKTREASVFEVDLGKILLVEDVMIGGYTSFFKGKNITAEGETKEAAVINLLVLYNTVLNSGNTKLNIKKILPK